MKGPRGPKGPPTEPPAFTMDADARARFADLMDTATHRAIGLMQFDAAHALGTTVPAVVTATSIRGLVHAAARVAACTGVDLATFLGTATEAYHHAAAEHGAHAPAPPAPPSRAALKIVRTPKGKRTP